MKTRSMIHGWLGVGLVVALLLPGCSAATTSAVSLLDASMVNAEVEAATIASATAIDTISPVLPATGLTEAEAAGLRLMREEEKLAHDVYLTLYELWGQPIFQNIAQSEATHTAAVLTLLERYGIADPVGDNTVGIFTDPTLQALYDALVAQGSESLIAALRVGAAVEEIDILDLEELSAQTDKADILNVYANLTKGSRNHLRSFVRILEQHSGEIYIPQYMGQEAYNTIISGAAERGPGGNQGQRGNGRD